MAAVPPLTVPLVANTDALVRACHDMLDDGKGLCEHKGGSIVSLKNCEIMAQALLDKGAFQSSAEMIDALKDNEDVQAIIGEAMANAWVEGHDAVCDDMLCSHRNPYTGKIV